jgi:hypothetical protein
MLFSATAHTIRMKNTNYKVYEIKKGDNYFKYTNVKLADLQSKYIYEINDKTKIFESLSKKTGFEFVVFGAHKDYTLLQKQDNIHFLANEKNTVPIKVVLLPDGRLFCDNTHWALAHLVRFGNDVKLKDLPFFIIDLQKEEPIIADYNGSILRKESYIKQTITYAQYIKDRVQKGWRPKKTSYTVGNLSNELFSKTDPEIVFE